MPTPRETILTALHARLSALPATALRGEVLPERVPTDGLLILRDGEPGEPEVTLSPLRYHYQHRAEIEAVVQGTDRDDAFDTLCSQGHSLEYLECAGANHSEGFLFSIDNALDFIDEQLSGSASAPSCSRRGARVCRNTP